MSDKLQFVASSWNAKRVDKLKFVGHLTMKDGSVPSRNLSCLTIVRHIERQNARNPTSREQRSQSVIHLSHGLRFQVLSKFFVNRFGHA